ncbi:hypothetical protein FA13DRAFT_1728444 [Coprinellus micaceus]|uniref:Uncharacterized protein n=1 Tax=Coprinellus micaceus TaxID=71717 RepID=A0A4Y7TN36_COPMI|nr:hypothetical protein FA13DRAFT_1728444 [Coprinellus micaceus]
MPLSRHLSLCETSLVEDSEPERIVIRDKMVPTSRRAPVDLGVIEIEDSDSGSASPVESVTLPIPTKSILANLKSPLPTSNTGGDLDSDVDTPMVPRTFDATQFAFGPGRLSQKPSMASTSRLPSKSNTPDLDALPQLEPAKKPARSKKQSLELSLVYTEKDIDRVLHCIACDAKWTTRKSSAQKSEHMRKCCKKAGYTQETTDALLHKALQDAPPSKSKAKEPEPPADIPTLLADIQPPEKKKRVRAVQVTSSVMDVRETGDEIRNRALQFLQGSSESPEPNRQQAAFPATQAFGQSRLGAAKATKSLFATDDDSASEAEAPAPIQQFGKSKLSANRSKKSLFAVDDPSGSASEAEGTGSPSKKKARGTRFSPSLGSTDHEAEALVPAIAAVSIHDRPRVGRSEKVKATPTKVVYGAAWEEELRHKILEDKELHMSILRLQPISLAKVLDLLDAGEKPNAKFERHVSAFLDKEGIHVSKPGRWGKKK